MKSRHDLEDEKLRLALYDQLGAEGKQFEILQKHLDRNDTRPLPPLSYKGVHRGRKRIRRLVLVAAVVAALLVGTVTVAANYEDIHNWFLSYAESSFALRNGKGRNGQEVDMTGHYLLSPMPEGYQITNITTDGTTITVCYTNGKKSFTFYQLRAYNGGLQDYEKADGTTELTVQDQPGLLTYEGNEIRLAWGSSPHFVIEGELEEAEALAFAESVSYVQG